MFNGGAGGLAVMLVMLRRSSAAPLPLIPRVKMTTPAIKRVSTVRELYQMHARLSMSRTRFLEERKRRKKRISKADNLNGIYARESSRSYPRVKITFVVTTRRTVANPQARSSKLYPTGLDDQMALEEIIREQRHSVNPKTDRRILKEACEE